MTRNKKIGEKGESLALDFIKKLSYEIIETNWTAGHKEIDIIAKQDSIYIFIEVKTRTSTKQGMPEESISESKIKSVTEAARIFLYDKSYKDIRFDVISIIMKVNSEPEIMHIKDAFY